MNLACGKNPSDLGIVEENGNWNKEAFAKHLADCHVCSNIAASILISAGQMLGCIPRCSFCERIPCICD